MYCNEAQVSLKNCFKVAVKYVGWFTKLDDDLNAKY